MLIQHTFYKYVIDNKLGKDDKDKRVNLKCQAYLANHITRSDGCSSHGPKCSLSCDWSAPRVDAFCLFVDVSMFRCRNQVVVGQETSVCWGAETAAVGVFPGLLLHCCCFVCPVVLVSLTTLKSDISNRTRGCPQVTFWIALIRSGKLVLKRAGADFVLVYIKM